VLTQRSFEGRNRTAFRARFNQQETARAPDDLDGRAGEYYPRLDIRVTSLFLLARIAKFLFFAVLAAGTVGAFWSEALRDRRRAVMLLATPGFVATWTLGFLLAYLTSTSLFEWWLLAAMALSLLSHQVAMFSVGRAGRRHLGVALLALGSLALTVVLMAWRGR
jgi:hypothetical protein